MKLESLKDLASYIELPDDISLKQVEQTLNTVLETCGRCPYSRFYGGTYYSKDEKLHLKELELYCILVEMIPNDFVPRKNNPKSRDIDEYIWWLTFKQRIEPDEKEEADLYILSPYREFNQSCVLMRVDRDTSDALTLALEESEDVKGRIVSSIDHKLRRYGEVESVAGGACDEENRLGT